MPNSILWIGLVVVWIVVLFPMLADRHPRIRQTTDAALSTRVLHRGGSKRRVVRGPASGHESDPNWRPSARTERSESRGIDAEDLMETHAEEPAATDEVVENEDVTVAAEAVAVEAEKIADTDELDGRPETEESVVDEVDEPRPSATDRREVPQRVSAEAPRAPEADEAPRERAPQRRGRGGFDPEADAIARAARYSFRQRAVLGLVLGAILFAALALVVSSKLWWVTAIAVIGLVAYLSYLRRQVRMEEEIRRRRMARMSRSRLGVESSTDEELELVPPRLRRAGAVVLESDDEDPVFDHLQHFDTASLERPVRRSADVQMRTAAGQ